MGLANRSISSCLWQAEDRRARKLPPASHLRFDVCKRLAEMHWPGETTSPQYQHAALVPTPVGQFACLPVVPTLKVKPTLCVDRTSFYLYSSSLSNPHTTLRFQGR